MSVEVLTFSDGTSTVNLFANNIPHYSYQGIEGHLSIAEAMAYAAMELRINQ